MLVADFNGPVAYKQWKWPILYFSSVMETIIKANIASLRNKSEINSELKVETSTVW